MLDRVQASWRHLAALLEELGRSPQEVLLERIVFLEQEVRRLDTCCTGDEVKATSARTAHQPGHSGAPPHS